MKKTKKKTSIPKQPEPLIKRPYMWIYDESEWDRLVDSVMGVTYKSLAYGNLPWEYNDDHNYANDRETQILEEKVDKFITHLCLRKFEHSFKKVNNVKILMLGEQKT